MIKRILVTIVGLAALCGVLRAEETKITEFSVALETQGAKAIMLKGPFNKDWPASSLLERDGRGGLMLNPPMKGASFEIRLLVPMPITAFEIRLLDYGGTRFVKSMDISIDGKLVKQGVEFGNELVEVNRRMTAPSARVDLDKPVKGQVIQFDVTEVHEPRVISPDKKPTEFGVIQRIRVFSNEDIAPFLAIPDGYKVSEETAIAFSEALAAVPKVYAEVRETPKGVNPNTIWDAKDIERMRELLKKSPEMQKQLDAMRKRLDDLMAQPIDIPKGLKNEAGEWIHTTSPRHTQLSLDISDLGIVYALTGEAKYGEFARKLLIAYATEYQNYRPGNRPGFQHDQGMLGDQRLDDSTWLLRTIRGYDLVANLPSWTPEDRELVTTKFLNHLAYFISGNWAHLVSPTNWSAISTAAILLTGYATHDEKLIDIGTHGITNRDGTRRGGMYYHFGPESIDVDGMWSEGAMGYQMMAMQALIAYAETMLHHGVNLYEYRDGAFKHLFDSPLWFSYPNLYAPAIHDSGYALSSVPTQASGNTATSATATPTTLPSSRKSRCASTRASRFSLTPCSTT